MGGSLDMRPSNEPFVEPMVLMITEGTAIWSLGVQTII